MEVIQNHLRTGEEQGQKAPTCDHTTREAEAEGSPLGVQPEFQSKTFTIAGGSMTWETGASWVK